jgi:NADP-dependent aldehyde dehydrogenase
MGPRPDLRRMLVPDRARRGVRGQQFPARVLRARRRHGECAGGRLPRRGQGARVAPCDVPPLLRTARAYRARSRRPSRHRRARPRPAAGADLVAHPAIQAVGFTGSLEGGTALQEVIAARPQPIPFYGEMSSINPVVVTEAAAADRGDEIGAGLVASFTMGAGQLCTKPGVALLPADAAGDQVVTAMSEALTDVPEQVLLNERIRDAYATGTEQLRSMPGVRVPRAVRTDHRPRAPPRRGRAPPRARPTPRLVDRDHPQRAGRREPRARAHRNTA